jgi:hypothetical protein
MSRLARCALVFLCPGLCALACTAFGTTPDAKSDATDAAAHAHAKDGSTAADATAVVTEAGGPPTYRAIVLGDGPISFFEFDDEQDPSTGILDSVTNTKKGDVVHQPDFTTAPLAGGSGHSATFDGNSWIVLDNTSYLFAGNAPFTVEAWIQTQTTDFQHVFTDQDRTAQVKRGYAITTFNGAVDAERFIGDTGIKPDSAPISSSPQYVALVYDGALLTLYLNGAHVDSANDTRVEQSHTVPAVIAAADPTGGSYAFTGAIDELAIYGKALPAAALAAHYLAGKQQ